MSFFLEKCNDFFSIKWMMSSGNVQNHEKKSIFNYGFQKLSFLGLILLKFFLLKISQWIKSQKMVRITKKDTCEICMKIEGKKCQKFINRT